jgi:hypothetical protein
LKVDPNLRPKILTTLREKSKELNLWNLFELVGISQVEFSLFFEVMGRSIIDPLDIFNCAFPHTPNIEV